MDLNPNNVPICGEPLTYSKNLNIRTKKPVGLEAINVLVLELPLFGTPKHHIIAKLIINKTVYFNRTVLFKLQWSKKKILEQTDF